MAGEAEDGEEEEEAFLRGLRAQGLSPRAAAERLWARRRGRSEGTAGPAGGGEPEGEFQAWEMGGRPGTPSGDRELWVAGQWPVGDEFDAGGEELWEEKMNRFLHMLRTGPTGEAVRAFMAPDSVSDLAFSRLWPELCVLLPGMLRGGEALLEAVLELLRSLWRELAAAAAAHQLADLFGALVDFEVQTPVKVSEAAWALLREWVEALPSLWYNFPDAALGSIAASVAKLCSPSSITCQRMATLDCHRGVFRKHASNMRVRQGLVRCWASDGTLPGLARAVKGLSRTRASAWEHPYEAAFAVEVFGALASGLTEGAAALEGGGGGCTTLPRLAVHLLHADCASETLPGACRAYLFQATARGLEAAAGRCEICPCNALELGRKLAEAARSQGNGRPLGDQSPELLDALLRFLAVPPRAEGCCGDGFHQRQEDLVALVHGLLAGRQIIDGPGTAAVAVKLLSRPCLFSPVFLATTGPALASGGADWHLTLLPPCAALTDPRHHALSPEGLRRLGTGTVLQDRVLSYNFSLLDGRPVSAVAASAGAARSEGRADSEGSVAFGLLHKIESLAQGITMEELMYGCPNRGRLSVFNTLRCHLCRVVWPDAPGHAPTIAGICRLASEAPSQQTRLAFLLVGATLASHPDAAVLIDVPDQEGRRDPVAGPLQRVATPRGKHVDEFSVVLETLALKCAEALGGPSERVGRSTLYAFDLTPPAPRRAPADAGRAKAHRAKLLSVLGALEDVEDEAAGQSEADATRAMPGVDAFCALAEDYVHRLERAGGVGRARGPRDLGHLARLLGRPLGGGARGPRKYWELFFWLLGDSPEHVEACLAKAGASWAAAAFCAGAEGHVRRVCHAVEVILAVDDPALAGAFRAGGISASAVVRTWMSQMYFSVLDWPPLMHFVGRLLDGEIDHAVYLPLHLLKSVAADIRRHADSGTLGVFLLEGPAIPFEDVAAAAEAARLRSKYGGHARAVLGAAWPGE